MYCFDTNIIVSILRGDKDLKLKLEKLMETMEEIFITPITLCELYKGAYLHHNPTAKVNEVNNYITWFSLLDFNGESSKEFGKEYARLSRLGKLTSEFDLMIACISKVNGLILVTRDKKHFDNIDVKLEVW